MKILMILTSHDTLGDTGEKTGFWLEEFASPYYVFMDNKVEVELASPKGGQPPLDPKSQLPDFLTDATERFNQDAAGQKALANTQRLSEVNKDDYDAVFYPGGHGPLWDLVEDSSSIQLIEAFFQVQKPIGLVCHAPAVLRDTKSTNGEPLVKGRRVTGFTNSEEEGVGLTHVVPFLVENMLAEKGGLYTKGDDWSSHIEIDGSLVTGQNPASSESVACALISLLK